MVPAAHSGAAVQVKAVVLRINSPGGSAVASDMIAREVQLLKESGKPVVACMGDVAASGGYYIAGDTTAGWTHGMALGAACHVLPCCRLATVQCACSMA
jgi:membrane-bound ClpP family serine protease